MSKSNLERTLYKNLNISKSWNLVQTIFILLGIFILSLFVFPSGIELCDLSVMSDFSYVFNMIEIHFMASVLMIFLSLFMVALNLFYYSSKGIDVHTLLLLNNLSEEDLSDWDKLPGKIIKHLRHLDKKYNYGELEASYIIEAINYIICESDSYSDHVFSCKMPNSFLRATLISKFWISMKLELFDLFDKDAEVETSLFWKYFDKKCDKKEKQANASFLKYKKKYYKYVDKENLDI